MSGFVWFSAMLILGAAAGYFLNRIALVYLSHYTQQSWVYGGFVGLLIREKQHSFSADMIAVEVAASLLSAAGIIVQNNSAELFFILPIVYLILLLSLIDSRIRILPNQLNFLGIAIGFGYAFFREDFTPADALLGMLTGGGFSVATAFLYQIARGHEGLGLGDVKLLAFFGSFAGWAGVLLIIMLGSFLGALWGIYAALRSNEGGVMQHEIPFGPFLGIAALGYLIILL